MAPRSVSRAAEAFRLTLVSYPPDRKVAVINAVREITGFSSPEARNLVATPPAVVKEFDDEDAAGEAHRALDAVGAHCLLHHLVDGKITGEDVDAEAQPSDSTAQDDGFHKLLSRLLNLVHHVRLVDQRLFDLQGVPEDLQPAAIALHDATQALDVLHTDFDSWHTHGVAAGVETAGGGGRPAVRLPDRVDVLLTACSKADKPAVVDRIHRTVAMAKDEIASMVDKVVRTGPLIGVATLPIEDAKALVRDLDALGADACIELTAASLREDPNPGTNLQKAAGHWEARS